MRLPAPITDFTSDDAHRPAAGLLRRLPSLALTVLGLAAFFALVTALTAPTEHKARIALWIAPGAPQSLDAVAIAPLAESAALKAATLAELGRHHREDRLRAALPALSPADPFARFGALIAPPARSSDDRLVAGLSRRLDVEATSRTTLVVSVTARDATIAADAAGAFAADLSTRLERALGARSPVRVTGRSVEAISRIDPTTIGIAGVFMFGVAASAAFHRRGRAVVKLRKPALPVTASLPSAGAEWIVTRRSSENDRFPRRVGTSRHEEALSSAVWQALAAREEAPKRLVVTGTREGREHLASNLAAEVARSGGRALIVDLADDLASSVEIIRAGFRDLAAGTVSCDAAIVRNASSGVHFMSKGFATAETSDEIEAGEEALAALEAAYDLLIILADEASEADPLEAMAYRGAVALIVAHRSDARIWPRLDGLAACGIADALLCPLDPGTASIDLV
ncbi:hypothetical protein [Amorphus coralli]|uniref:hypothetical protein n=1 Tax=Amorphus coralli TaxID=340680 RepID=UPI00037222DB|nr:hypothetical protein [Amorphus coralli]